MLLFALSGVPLSQQKSCPTLNMYKVETLAIKICSIKCVEMYGNLSQGWGYDPPSPLSSTVRMRSREERRNGGPSLSGSGG